MLEHVGAKRARSQTSFYDISKAVEPTPKATTEYKQGSGMKLADNEVFCGALQKLKADSELLKCLHMAMYNTAGKRVEIKKKLRMFSGFGDDSKRTALIAKVTDKKKTWTVDILKQSLGAFGVERSGDRAALIQRFANYVAAPSTPTRMGVRASSTKKGKKKRNKSSTVLATLKEKKPPSAYILFSNSERVKAKAEFPDATFPEISRIVGERWGTLSKEEKQGWIDIADQRKKSGLDTTESGIDFGSDDSDEESDNEQDGEQLREIAPLNIEDGAEEDDFLDD